MRTAAALLMLSLPRSNVPSQIRSPEKSFPVESFLYIWNRSQAATYPPPLGACALFTPFRVSGAPEESLPVESPSIPFPVVWNHTPTAATRFTPPASPGSPGLWYISAKAFACPKSHFLSTPPPSPFHLSGMNLFILPSSIPHAPPSQISLLLNQTSHSLNLRLLNFSKHQPSSALP